MNKFKVKVSSGRLNLREVPQGKVIGKLDNGAVVEKIDEVGNWFKVQVGGMIGYVSRDYLVEIVETAKIDNPTWLDIAKAEIGQKEIEGVLDNPRIIDYHRATQGGTDVHDEIPWCASFVCWCLEKAGLQHPRSKRVVDFSNYGRKLSFEERKVGSIITFRFQAGGRHVCFLSDLEIHNFESGDRLCCLGGNQSNTVKYSNFLIEDITGIHWPV